MKLRGHGGAGGSAVTPLTITSTAIPLTGEAGSSYAGFTVTGHGGTAPYTYSIPVGTLPPPLALNSSTGAVPSATLSTNGNYGSITIRVTDSLGATADLASFSIIVAAAPTPIPPPADITPAGGDGTVPTESAVVYGSGCTQKVIAAFDEHPYIWIETSTHYITVAGAVADRGWIAYVDFWLNGNVVRVSAQAKNSRTGGMGFCVNPLTGAGADGDYTLYARVVPTNGYERLISIPITLNSNGTIVRAERYINYSTGNDSTGNGLTAGTPWKTFLKATLSAPSGAIVYFEPSQTYTEDSNTGTVNSNSRLIEFRPRGGSGRATITRTTRITPTSTWTPRCNKVRYNAVDFDLAKIPAFQASGTNNYLIAVDCTFIDSNGVTGPTYGYTTTADASGNLEIAQTVFGQSNTKMYICESTFSGVCSVGAVMLRNCTLTYSWDAVAFTSNALMGGSSIWNTTGTQSGQFKNRLSVPNTLTVATVSAYDSANNRTTITWSGSPKLAAVSNASNALAITAAATMSVLTGAKAATDGYILTQTDATDTTVLVGNFSTMVPGDTAWVWQVAHADTFQVIGNTTSASANIENIYVQRYSAGGTDNQPILAQAGSSTGSGTLSTSGTTVTFTSAQTLRAGDFIQITNGTVGLLKYQYVRVSADVTSSTTATIDVSFTANYDGTGGNANAPAGTTFARGRTAKDVALVGCVLTGNVAEIAQYQHGQQHWVVAQCTMLSSSFMMRNATAGFGLSGCAFFDSVWNGTSTGHTHSMDHDSAPGAFPTVGITIDNNQFGAGTARGTNTTVASVTFDATAHPTAGLSRAVRGHQGHASVSNGVPLMPWDLDGDAIAAGALIGAQQAP